MYSGGELPCPGVNVNTLSRENAEVTRNVASWGACSNLCRQRQGCTAWSWHHENAGQWALQCVTMTGYGYTAHDTNVVSGGRDCETGTFQPCTSRRHRSTWMCILKSRITFLVNLWSLIYMWQFKNYAITDPQSMWQKIHLVNIAFRKFCNNSITTKQCMQRCSRGQASRHHIAQWSTIRT